MAGAGRTCIITVFPFLGTLAAFAITIVILLGSIRPSVLPQIYGIRIDIGQLNATGALQLLDVPDGVSGVLSNPLLESQINRIANSNDFADFYTVNLWNYCKGNIKQNGDYDVTWCKDPKAMYYFNVTEVVQEQSGNAIIDQAVQTASSLEKVRDYLDTLKAANQGAWVCYIISVCLLFITLLVGIFSYKSRGVHCCTAFIALITLIATILASGLATGTYIVLRNLINDNIGQYGITASLSNTFLGLSWGAAAATLWATIWWFISICCGSTSSRAKNGSVYEKEPMMTYEQYR